MCASRSSRLSSWRWLALAAALISGMASAAAQEAPLSLASSQDPATAPSWPLSSLSTSELSALWYATLAEQRQRSQEDRERFESYVASSEQAAETAMLRELSLSRIVQRLQNRLQAATTAIDDSGTSATNSSAAFKAMADEAEAMRRSRNLWRAGAVAAAGLAILSFFF